MKRAIVLILAVVFIAAAAGPALAAEKAAAKPVEKAKAQRPRQHTGEVVTVDTAAKSLTVKGKNAEMVFTTDDKSTVKINKDKKTLADVKLGDKVTVKYSVVDGKNMVQGIEVKPPKPEGAAEKKAAEAPKPAAKPAEKPAQPKSGGY